MKIAFHPIKYFQQKSNFQISIEHHFKLERKSKILLGLNFLLVFPIMYQKESLSLILIVKSIKCENERNLILQIFFIFMTILKITQQSILQDVNFFWIFCSKIQSFWNYSKLMKVKLIRIKLGFLPVYLDWPFL